jgi:SAM-dependent methyltransferase
MDNYEYCAAWAHGRGRVLDYGCGAGHIVRLMRSQGLDAHGCEVFYGGNTERTFENRAADIAPFIHKIENGLIPFPDASFDAVTTNQVLEHVEDFDAVLKEIARVLKPGGQLLALFPDKSIWREGHCGIPFQHWFPKASRRRKILYAAALRALGAGFHKDECPGVFPWARWQSEWVDKWTHYLPPKTVDSLFARYFHSTERIELDWLSARLPGKPVHLVPAFVRRFATRRLICGRVMVAVK